MRMRTWSICGGLAVLVGSTIVIASPPKAREQGVDGKVPPPLTQEYYEREPSPAPRLLPRSIRETTPNEPTAASLIQLVSASSISIQIQIRTQIAFDKAEAHFLACEEADAEKWYREVIRLAPGSVYAMSATKRLDRNRAKPTQSAEPPFADSRSDDNLSVRKP